MALIDVESCGLSRVDWPDVLPHLHNSYDAILGFAHFAGRGPSHPHELCDLEFDNSRIANTLACCDLAFWTSDSLLGFDDVPDYEARTPVLTALVHDFLHALSANSPVRNLAGISEARLRPERPHRKFSASLEYDEEGVLLIDRRIVL